MGPLASDHPSPVSLDPQTGSEEPEGPVTPFFLEALFTSLRGNLQTVKKDLSQDLKTVLRDLARMGDKVYTLEDNEPSRDEDIEQLQQAVIRLKEQQIHLQAHAEYLDKR
ncbi:hypothetical protein NDU88_009180 [Pleurodeles waltl]|uniref:Mediator complex subunit 9 n=1 Tax=Pleurodeles waltl TaxID=8319 RepID=A0AAV7RXT5_PLEWA|nr:hypothetical protein NDU88_009166 [Pleurodeles waltl]KAJ1156461.1 hypothetical protein NDU88_009180 [Pleurodeles waltl]